MKCNFTYKEATTTSTGLPNDLDLKKHMDSFMRALVGMQAVRNLLNTPITVNSWYRSEAVNKAVGGSKTSSHMNAEAIDFVPKGMAISEAYKMIACSDIEFDQLIIYRKKGFIHIGFGSRNRRELREG